MSLFPLNGREPGGFTQVHQILYCTYIYMISSISLHFWPNSRHHTTSIVCKHSTLEVLRKIFIADGIPLLINIFRRKYIFAFHMNHLKCQFYVNRLKFEALFALKKNQFVVTSAMISSLRVNRRFIWRLSVKQYNKRRSAHYDLSSLDLTGSQELIIIACFTGTYLCTDEQFLKCSRRHFG